MARSARLSAILMVVMFLTSAMLVFVPSAMAQMSLQPTLSLSPLNPQSREVVVTPSSIGSAAFSATVTVTKPPAVGIVQVQLDGSCTTGWPTVVSPQTIPFTAPGDVQITVTVVVPQATPTSSIGRILVSGIATYPGGSRPASTAATVTIVQYFRLNPQSMQAFVTIPPGGKAMLNLELYNRGNGLDTISIDFPNIKDLKKEDWVVIPSTYQVDNVPMDEYDTIKINIEPKRPFLMSYKHGEITYIELIITSDNAAIAGQGQTKKFMFAIMVHGFFIPGFDITFIVMAFAMIGAILARRNLVQKRR